SEDRPLQLQKLMQSSLLETVALNLQEHVATSGYATQTKVPATPALARRKNKRGRDCDEECGLKLDDEVRLAYQGERHFNSARGLALQLQPNRCYARVCKYRPWNRLVRNAGETAFKERHLFDRLFGPNFRRPSGKANKIGSRLQ